MCLVRISHIQTTDSVTVLASIEIPNQKKLTLYCLYKNFFCFNDINKIFGVLMFILTVIIYKVGGICLYFCLKLKCD